MILFLKFPWQDSLGGAEDQTTKLANQFKKNGKNICLLTSDKKLLAVFNKNGLTAKYLWIGWEPTSKQSLLLWPLTFLIAKYKLWKAIKKEKSIEAVFMQSLTEKLCFPYSINNVPISKIFFWEHKVPGKWLDKNPLKNQYINLANSVSVITVSNYAKEKFIKLGVARNKISIIYPGIKIEPPRTPKNNPLIIGILSRIDPEKGVFDFIKKITPALKKQPRWKVYIAGDGQEKNQIVEYISKNRLNNQIQPIGWIENKKIFFSKISVLCYPSIAPESFGLAAAEAQSYSIPVVANRSGALNEIISPGSGFLINNFVWEDSFKILENPKNYKKMSESARDNAQNFSETKMYKKFESLLQ